MLLTGCASPQPHAGTDVVDPNTVTTDSGLQYLDRKIGTGASPVQGDTVAVHYTGTLENGTKFDSSLDRGAPFVFVVGTGAVISGWDEGILGMREGGVRRLIVPSSLGYGARSVGSIPPHSTLIFDLELIEVKQPGFLDRLLKWLAG